MLSRDTLALGAALSVAAIASGIVVLALDQTGPVEVVPVHIVSFRSAPAETTSSQITTSSLQSSDQAIPATQEAPLSDGSPLRPASYTEEQPESVGDAEHSDVSSDAASQDWSAEVRASPTRVPPPANSQSLPSKTVAPSTAQSSTLKDRLAEISPAATERLKSKFTETSSAWPPANIALVAIKDEKTLDLYARSSGGKWTFVHRYPVLASSGVSGPKLRHGDKQVPEGIYGISLLNPNSRFHVSMRVSYPNDFDRRMAVNDGRKDLGGDIMIHGKNASIGCLAIGDEASEELFVLASQVGLHNIKVIIAPTDFRKSGIPTPDAAQPKWVPALYTQVASAMSEFEAPPSSSLLSFFWK